MRIFELQDILDQFEDHNLDQETNLISLLTLDSVPEGHHANNLQEKASKPKPLVRITFHWKTKKCTLLFAIDANKYQT